MKTLVFYQAAAMMFIASIILMAVDAESLSVFVATKAVGTLIFVGGLCAVQTGRRYNDLRISE